MSIPPSVFTNHFNEFFDDIASIFPDDVDIQMARTAFDTMRKTNPRILIDLWRQYVVVPYRSEIESGNITFFEEHDYTEDIVKSTNGGELAAKALQAIDRLRDPIRRMSPENKQKCMQYFKNFLTLSDNIASR